jgi:hypothetical protein
MAGSGSLPARCSQIQNNAVEALSAPLQAPISRGLYPWEAIPAAIIDTIIVDHVIDSRVEKTRPRNSSGTCFRS